MGLIGRGLWIVGHGTDFLPVVARLEIVRDPDKIKENLGFESLVPRRVIAGRAGALSDLMGSFDGPERLIRAMGRSGAARGAMWVPRSQIAGKRRNTADEPLRPPSSNLAEGRVLWSPGRVALLIRCLASHLEALLTTGQINPVE